MQFFDVTSIDKIFVGRDAELYHILSQIGYKIGSPIREKVDPFILTKFDVAFIELYVKEVEKTLASVELVENGRILPLLMAH